MYVDYLVITTDFVANTFQSLKEVSVDVSRYNAKVIRVILTVR